MACGGSAPPAKRTTTAVVASDARRARASQTKRRAKALPKDGAPGSHRVGLHFEWPHGLSASVRVTRSRQHDREQARSTITYKLGVAEIDGGRRFSYAAYVPYLEVPGAPPTEQHGMRERLAELVNAMTTDAEGAFTGLYGLERSSRTKRLEALGVRGKHRRKLASRVITDEALIAAAKHFWEQRVGRWRGHTQLVQGETYEEPDTLPVPELDDAVVSAVTTYRFVGWAKCTPDAAAAECVELHLETRAEPESLAEATRAFKKRRRRGGSITELQKRTRVVLVTEPATLRPRRYEEDQFTMVGQRDPRGNETQSMTTDNLVEEYSYP